MLLRSWKIRADVFVVGNAVLITIRTAIESARSAGAAIRRFGKTIPVLIRAPLELGQARLVTTRVVLVGDTVPIVVRDRRECGCRRGLGRGCRCRRGGGCLL